MSHKRIAWICLVCLVFCHLPWGAALADGGEGDAPAGMIVPAETQASMPGGLGTVMAPKPGEMVALREGPSDGARLIMAYYTGAHYWSLGSSRDYDGWAYVNFWGQTGYIPRACALEYTQVDEDEMRARYEVPTAIVRVPEGKTSVPLMNGTKGSEWVDVSLTDGTVVLVLGEAGRRSQVRVGNVYGLVESAFLERTGELGSWLYDFPPIGHAVVTGKGMEQTYLRTVPGASQNQDDRSDYGGWTFWLYGVAEADAQIGYCALQGFLPLDTVQLYLYSDLYGAERQELPEGNYTAGKDFAPGLYTFAVKEGEAGRLSTLIGGMERSYEAEGAARFDVFLPEGASVTAAGGRLIPTVREEYFAREDAKPLAGNGKLLITGDSVGSTHRITAMDGKEPSRYTITSLYCEEGEGEPKVTYTLDPGESRDQMIMPGEFIEIENCVLEAMHANG